MRTRRQRAIGPSGGAAGRCERPCVSAGRHAWLHMRGVGRSGRMLLAGALMRYLPGRGGAPGALTSAGGLSWVAGLVALGQAVWVR